MPKWIKLDRRGSGWLTAGRNEAVHIEGKNGEYDADGSGTDRVGIALREGQLWVFGGRYKLAAKPWLMAKPMKID